MDLSKLRSKTLIAIIFMNLLVIMIATPTLPKNANEDLFLGNSSINFNYDNSSLAEWDADTKNRGFISGNQSDFIYANITAGKHLPDNSSWNQSLIYDWNITFSGGYFISVYKRNENNAVSIRNVQDKISLNESTYNFSQVNLSDNASVLPIFGLLASNILDSSLAFYNQTSYNDVVNLARHISDLFYVIYFDSFNHNHTIVNSTDSNFAWNFTYGNGSESILIENSWMTNGTDYFNMTNWNDTFYYDINNSSDAYSNYTYMWNTSSYYNYTDFDYANSTYYWNSTFYQSNSSYAYYDFNNSTENSTYDWNSTNFAYYNYTDNTTTFIYNNTGIEYFNNFTFSNISDFQNYTDPMIDYSAWNSFNSSDSSFFNNYTDIEYLNSTYNYFNQSSSFASAQSEYAFELNYTTLMYNASDLNFNYTTEEAYLNNTEGINLGVSVDYVPLIDEQNSEPMIIENERELRFLV